MHRVSHVEPLEGHRLFIEFTDGVAGVVELADRLFGPVFEPLQDGENFSQVEIDEFGVICWPGGADLAPDALYASLTKVDSSAKRTR